MELFLNSFATTRHVVRNAPSGAFNRLVSQAVVQFPKLAVYLKMIPHLFMLSHIERFTPPQAVIVGSYILILARILELVGTLLQAKTSVENSFKSTKALLTNSTDKNPTQAMMRSICILHENQKTIMKLQLLFNIATTNINAYLHNKDTKLLDEEEYVRNVNLIKKELRDIKRVGYIDVCNSNLKKGIPIVVNDYDDGDEYDIGDGDGGGRGKHKTSKRQRHKPSKRKKTKNRFF